MKKIIGILTVIILLSSCASSYCSYSAKANRTKNLCPAYR